MYKLIEKKKAEKELSEDDITHFITDLNKGDVSDEDACDFLKCFDNNISFEESFYFAKAMSNSGRKPEIKMDKCCVEKTSIGGFSSVVSLIVAPVLSALGFYFPKMTSINLEKDVSSLDRLKLIPGFNTAVLDAQINKILKRTGICFFEKPKDVVPVEQKMHNILKLAKMDFSLPFLAIMSMSKKLALPIKYMALDIRCGEGSHIKNMIDAETLAEYFLKIAEMAKIKMKGTLTYVTEPIDKNLGIRRELVTAILILSGKKAYKKSQLFATAKDIVFSILSLAKIANSRSVANEMMVSAIDSGLALEKFMQMVLSQNGSITCFDNPEMLLPNQNTTKIVAEKTGYMEDIKIDAIKRAISIMGGLKDEDGKILDDAAGIDLFVNEDNRVKKGQTLANVSYSMKNPKFASGIRAIREAFVIGGKRKNMAKFAKKEISNE